MAYPEPVGIAAIFDQTEKEKSHEPREIRIFKLNGLENMVAAEAEDLVGQSEFRHVQFEPGSRQRAKVAVCSSSRGMQKQPQVCLIENDGARTARVRDQFPFV